MIGPGRPLLQEERQRERRIQRRCDLDKMLLPLHVLFIELQVSPHEFLRCHGLVSFAKARDRRTNPSDAPRMLMSAPWQLLNCQYSHQSPVAPGWPSADKNIRCAPLLGTILSNSLPVFVR